MAENEHRLKGRKCPRIKRDRDMIVSMNIKKYRLLSGLSQQALANELGITFQQVQKYEHATNRTSAGTLFDIAIILGVPIAHMFMCDADDKVKGSDNIILKTLGNKPPLFDDEVAMVRKFRRSSANIQQAVSLMLGNFAETDA